MIDRAFNNYGNYGSGTASGQSRWSLREFCQIFFRHKKKMALTFFGTLALFIGVVATYPRTYGSDAKLLVRMGKESVGLDPTATVSQTVAVESSRETEINSEMEILRSRVVLEDVVDRLGPDAVLMDFDPTTMATDGEPTADATSADLSAAGALSANSSRREKAVTTLGDKIWVTAPRRSSVIAVGCMCSSPAKAQRLLQAFLDAYLLRHVKANRTVGSYEFFVQQANLVQGQLSQAAKELRDAKNAIGIVSIEGQRQTLQSQADSIAVATLVNQRGLAFTRAQLKALNETVKHLPADQIAEETVGLPNIAGDNMRTDLYRVQILEQEARAKYTEKHPTAIALHNQVEEAKRIFDAQTPERKQMVRRLNTVHQSLQRDMAMTGATEAAQLAEAEALAAQREAVQTKIRALNENDSHIVQLAHRVELLETDFRSYSNNREKARINQALEALAISNVNVIQPPTYVSKATSPRVSLGLLMSLLVATAGSVLVVFGAEFFDRSVKTPEQIEQDLGIPVLFSVPRGATHDLLTRSR